MRVSLLFSLVLAIGLAACQSEAPELTAEDPSSDPPAVEEVADEYAVAEITGLNDSGVSGTVTFLALGSDGVQIRYDLAGLEGEAHGFHLHENGSCAPGDDGTPGGAAGGHFNPMESPHGAPSASPANRHAGDLGNVRVSAEASGIARGSLADSVLTFGGPTDVVGKAVIVHAGADDLTSQPSGDAGARVGCGVIVLAEQPASPSAETSV
ncbi:MAG: superoxide dismutase family protein [Bacteroidota bacterium]